MSFEEAKSLAEALTAEKADAHEAELTAIYRKKYAETALRQVNNRNRSFSIDR